jgi:prepilin peptidase CpaA
LFAIVSDFIAVGAILLFAAAAYSDICSLRIPNSYCIAVALLGVAQLFLFWLKSGDLVPVLETLTLAIIILLIGVVSFALRYIGGGDAKFMAAIVLLIGAHDFLTFTMLMSVVGAVLAMLMLAMKHSPLPAYLGPRFAAFAFTTKVQVPYGVAISVAGSVILVAQLYFNFVIPALKVF